MTYDFKARTLPYKAEVNIDWMGAYMGNWTALDRKLLVPKVLMAQLRT